MVEPRILFSTQGITIHPNVCGTIAKRNYVFIGLPESLITYQYYYYTAATTTTHLHSHDNHVASPQPRPCQHYKFTTSTTPTPRYKFLDLSHEKLYLPFVIYKSSYMFIGSEVIVNSSYKIGTNTVRSSF